MADVFISYSRKDAGFVHALQAALKDAGRETWVDLADIAPSADWLAEIHAAIDEAGAFLFIISPESVSSRPCADELAYAEQQHKRLIPVVYRTVPRAAVPPVLQPLNWLFYRETDDGAGAFVALLQALDTDLAWVKAHTRLLTQALEWERQGHRPGYLLRGETLHAAEAALAGVDVERSPQPTPLQRAFVLASRRHASRTQQRTLSGLGVAAMILAVVALFALVQRQDAVSQRTEALHQQRIATSREQAASSLRQLTVDPERSLLLALEAVKSGRTPEAEDALRQAVVESRGRGALGGLAAAALDLHLTPYVSVSEDARYAIAIGVDGNAPIWDRETGAAISTLRGLSGNTIDGRFSADDRYLLTRDLYDTTTVWDWQAARQMYVVHRGSGGVSTGTTVWDWQATRQAINPDATLLVIAGADGTVRVWDMSRAADAGPVVELQPTRTGASPPPAVGAVSFSHDGRYLATGDGDSMVHIWEVGNWRQRMELRATAPVTEATFSANDKYLLVHGNNEPNVWVWDWQAGKQLFDHTSRTSLVRVSRFSPDGRFILTGEADGSTTVWGLGVARELFTLRGGHTGAIRDVAMSPDSRWIVTAGEDGTVRVWAGPAAETVLTFGSATQPVSSAAFSADGRYVATGAQDAVQVRELSTRTLVAELQQQLGVVTTVAFSPDGSRLAAGSDTGTVAVWDWRAGGSPADVQLLKPAQEGPLGFVSALQFSPDGASLVTAMNAPGVLVRDAHTGEVTVPLTRPGEGHAAAFSPDGQVVATGGQGGVVRVSDARTGKVVASIQQAKGFVNQLSFSPDGSRIVAGNTDNAVRLWDWQRTGIVQTITGHTDVVFGVGFSPDGQWLVSTSQDSSVRIWEAKTGRRVAELWGHGSPAWSPAFSPDGTLLLTTGGDGTAQLSRCEACVPLAQLVALAHTHLTRELTCAERVTFLHAAGTCPEASPQPAASADTKAPGNLTGAVTGAVATLAGTGTLGFANGPGAAAQFNTPASVAVDMAGSLYVADANNNRIRKISPDGTVSTLAGTGVAGYADGAAATAQFTVPIGVAVDATGTVYVAEQSNRVRRIAPDGTVSTLAGSGIAGFADGPAATAQFYPVPLTVQGVAVDASGTVYIGDVGNARIRKITPDGTVSTLAGSGTPGFADGPAATEQFNLPMGVAVDATGAVIVADVNNNRIRKITPDGTVSTLAGTGTAGFADGPAGTAQFNKPANVAVDAAGTLYVADAGNHRIRKIARDGMVSTLAGNGTPGFTDGPAATAQFRRPASVAVDAAGVVYIADVDNNRIRKIILGGQ